MQLFKFRMDPARFIAAHCPRRVCPELILPLCRARVGRRQPLRMREYIALLILQDSQGGLAGEDDRVASLESENSSDFDSSSAASNSDGENYAAATPAPTARGTEVDGRCCVRCGVYVKLHNNVVSALVRAIDAGLISARALASAGRAGAGELDAADVAAVREDLVDIVKVSI